MGKIENDRLRAIQNEHFIKAFEYVAQCKNMNQTQLATAIGSKTAYISKYRNGTKPVQDEEMDALVRISTTIDDGQIYHPYLLGQSEYMLLRNVPDDEIAEVERRRNNPDYEIMKQQRALSQTIDQSSLINAALAAKDETIASLRDRLMEKDQLIKTKDELIAALRRQLELVNGSHAPVHYPRTSEQIPIAAENK